MREARHRQNVRKLRGEPGVGIRGVLVILLRLIRRLHAEESGVVRSLAMDKRNQSLVSKLLLATVGDGDFCGTLQGHISFIGAESMCRESFDKASAFHTA